ncbi:VOC family protein [Paenibacillus sinopodophylli]|uniref:VOC family protein n=1 Tax=Paenibacillus sinopodophylli TaxID=1837342 RepID=UPI00110CE5E9|nr:VOC family protein [Paenibacillus sinopodophylli]
MTKPLPMITQICIVVHDAEQASANWANVLGVQQAPAETITMEGLLHYTYGNLAEYNNCKVAKYELEHLILELMQPAESPSPWRTFLDHHGQGVFHFCMFVDDRKSMYSKLGAIGVELPYHVGYAANGSYSYVNSKAQLGLELSVNNVADNSHLMELLAQGTAKPLDEVKLLR